MGTALFLCIYSSSWSAVVWPLQAVYHPGSPVLKNWACNFHKKSFWMWQCRGVQPPPVIAAGLFCDAQSMHRSGLLSVPLWDWASLLDCSPWTKTLGLYVALHHLPWAEHQINLHTAQNSHCVWRERFAWKCPFFFSPFFSPLCPEYFTGVALLLVSVPPQWWWAQCLFGCLALLPFWLPLPIP